MDYLDYRNKLVDLSSRLTGTDQLTDDDRSFLASALYRIGAGEDANKVFQVKPKRGQKHSDATDKRRMSYILHWIAEWVNPPPDSGEEPISLDEACELAMKDGGIVQVAKKSFPGNEDAQYDAEYLRRCWYKSEYSHMRSPVRNWTDPANPYRKTTPVKDTK